MRLGAFSTVSRLVDERRKLEQKLKGKLGVTIGGAYQDEVLVELVRPVIEHHLDGQMRLIDQELEALGVYIP